MVFNLPQKSKTQRGRSSERKARVSVCPVFRHSLVRPFLSHFRLSLPPLSPQFHPDRNKAANAKERFQEVSEAYDVSFQVLR
jgi:hypothetical protein